jgi:ABC-2 type transport system ATP-binding protein
MLQLRNLHKKYGDTVILDSPNLDLGTGIYWIKGANGAGKTNSLNFSRFITLSGANLPPGQSRVKTGRYPAPAISKLQPSRTFIPGFLNRPAVSKFSNSRYIYPTGNKVVELTERLQVDDFLHQPIGSYSSGMLKKLSLLWAFLGKPALIILDEPLITLDAAAVITVNQLILKYYQKQEISFLLSSHQNFIPQDLPLTATLLFENKILTFL